MDLKSKIELQNVQKLVARGFR